MAEKKNYCFDTLAQHACYDPKEHHGYLSEPIYEGVVQTQPNCKTAARIFSGAEEGFIYGRLGNETARIFEKRLAVLEGGEDALSFTTGMAAIRCLILKLAGLGDNIVSSRQLYGGTGHFFETEMPKQFGRGINFVDNPWDANSWAKAINCRTKAFYMEWLANPTIDLYPFLEIASMAKRHRLPLIVDSTFASPALFRPIPWGATFAVHSATKYLSCGGVNLAGAVVGPKKFLAEMRENEYLSYGAPLSAFHARFCLIGLSTLSLRMKRHSENAERLASWFWGRRFEKKKSSLGIKNVFYPNLSDSPYAVYARNFMPEGCGGVFSVEFDCSLEKCAKFIDSLKIFSIAPSLGECKSLVIMPSLTTHSKLSCVASKGTNIPPNLIRFAVGLEDPWDLIKDLRQAFSSVGAKPV
ncbi:hypothetical protein A2833_02030 [Candidatus Azambacteria bacterium RIFCSPHIGHO2_01_FULL_44_55]|uniref:Uncharacterized protein n=1 Tax=Candidatus Azambacteria bacterium RIFCSPLOWO2_02_FULL_44_14 TaxID=1797306 RepID=A0A1F5CAS0_9BACT|nr:MAG: hypothetical protein A3A18_01775 [Candidatus Azambacteria bacterium RIFCSPLOWO2_01_FULL_44_84]OGD33466.1 MAG: hypothetical protein A3C78_00060 [Candidatus Azambacteria bacterium RIFCSPHIGHO2_02_FULL_45_18]OGD39693.1 MAG: hypothetical protein A2833_02030 [Candidatus Azambacteria bacterium RIFCSPHIGHO2_01_FULL_44_55]OGD39970.1 MAG: hypothetical protein A3I30_02065 [Candidatus Azambacteria bacterium RIFCSPLOWO2_02_FULL_44_14]OGD52446.1 MAG: hypothetical protein A2608_00440 [Candidatus Azam